MRASARPASFYVWSSRTVAPFLLAVALCTGCGGRYAAPAAAPSATAAHTAPNYSSLPEEEVRRRANSGSDAAALRELAYRALQKGDPEAALRHLDLALTLEPNSADAHNIRGMAFVQQSQAGQAAREFQAAVKCAPQRIGARLNLGRLFLGAGHSAVAAQVFQEALKIDPKSFEAASLAGDAWRQAGSSLAAARYYRQALEIRPDDPKTLGRLGEMLVNRGRWEEARDTLTRARERGDTEPHTRAYLGLAWAMTAANPEEAKTALEHLEGARAAGEQGSHVYYGLGLAYLARHDLPRAEQVVKEGLRRYPDVPGLHYTLADVYAGLGRAAESRKSREQSAELTVLHAKEERFVDDLSEHPKEIQRYLVYADWLLGRHEGDRALPLLRQAQRIEAKNPEVTRRIAVAEQQVKASRGTKPGRGTAG